MLGAEHWVGVARTLLSASPAWAGLGSSVARTGVSALQQPNVRRQATFSNRDTESVVALTPNIGLDDFRCRFSSKLHAVIVLDPQLLWILLHSKARRSNLQTSRRENSWFFSRRKLGGADRDRTGGLLVANQALSQLSYSPMNPATSF